MTNVLLAGFTSYWHRRKSSMRTTQGERPPALRGCPLLRSVPSLWSGMREQSRSISRGLKINKNSAEGEVFLVDFPSYRTLQFSMSYRTDSPRMMTAWRNSDRLLPATAVLACSVADAIPAAPASLMND